MYPEIEPFSTGHLKVSEIHTLYYEVCGNDKGKPVVFLHGGPGPGFGPFDRRFFNPQKYKIVLFDQRGCGKSTPHGCLEENTTWDLVKDIERLRQELNIEKWHVFGGSWGSTLSLAYAQSHPDRVISMIMRGIFTITKSEIYWASQDGASRVFPEAYEEFISIIPEEERHDIFKAYYKRLTSSDEATGMKYAKAWCTWENTFSRFYGVDPGPLVLPFSDEVVYTTARMEFHYFVHSGWMREGQLLEKQEIDKIRHIPTIVINGRYDLACAPSTAWALKKVWPEITLHFVQDAGHGSRESGTKKLLVEATDKFAEL